MGHLFLLHFLSRAVNIEVLASLSTGLTYGGGFLSPLRLPVRSLREQRVALAHGPYVSGCITYGLW